MFPALPMMFGFPMAMPMMGFPMATAFGAGTFASEAYASQFGPSTWGNDPLFANFGFGNALFGHMGFGSFGLFGSNPAFSWWSEMGSTVQRPTQASHQTQHYASGPSSPPPPRPPLPRDVKDRGYEGKPASPDLPERRTSSPAPTVRPEPTRAAWVKDAYALGRYFRDTKIELRVHESAKKLELRGQGVGEWQGRELRVNRVAVRRFFKQWSSKKSLRGLSVEIGGETFRLPKRLTKRAKQKLIASMMQALQRVPATPVDAAVLKHVQERFPTFVVTPLVQQQSGRVEISLMRPTGKAPTLQDSERDLYAMMLKDALKQVREALQGHAVVVLVGTERTELALDESQTDAVISALYGAAPAAAAHPQPVSPAPVPAGVPPIVGDPTGVASSPEPRSAPTVVPPPPPPPPVRSNSAPVAQPTPAVRPAPPIARPQPAPAQFDMQQWRRQAEAIWAKVEGVRAVITVEQGAGLIRLKPSGDTLPPRAELGLQILVALGSSAAIEKGMRYDVMYWIEPRPVRGEKLFEFAGTSKLSHEAVIAALERALPKPAPAPTPAPPVVQPAPVAPPPKPAPVAPVAPAPAPAKFDGDRWMVEGRRVLKRVSPLLRVVVIEDDTRKTRLISLDLKSPSQVEEKYRPQDKFAMHVDLPADAASIRRMRKALVAALVHIRKLEALPGCKGHTLWNIRFGPDLELELYPAKVTDVDAILSRLLVRKNDDDLFNTRLVAPAVGYGQYAEEGWKDHVQRVLGPVARTHGLELVVQTGNRGERAIELQRTQQPLPNGLLTQAMLRKDLEAAFTELEQYERVVNAPGGTKVRASYQGKRFARNSLRETVAAIEELYQSVALPQPKPPRVVLTQPAPVVGAKSTRGQLFTVWSARTLELVQRFSLGEQFVISTSYGPSSRAISIEPRKGVQLPHDDAERAKLLDRFQQYFKAIADLETIARMQGDITVHFESSTGKRKHEGLPQDLAAIRTLLEVVPVEPKPAAARPVVAVPAPVDRFAAWQSAMQMTVDSMTIPFAVTFAGDVHNRKIVLTAAKDLQVPYQRKARRALIEHLSKALMAVSMAEDGMGMTGETTVELRGSNGRTTHQGVKISKADIENMLRVVPQEPKPFDHKTFNREWKREVGRLFKGISPHLVVSTRIRQGTRQVVLGWKRKVSAADAQAVLAGNIGQQLEDALRQSQEYDDNVKVKLTPPVLIVGKKPARTLVGMGLIHAGKVVEKLREDAPEVKVAKPQPAAPVAVTKAAPGQTSITAREWKAKVKLWMPTSTRAVGLRVSTRVRPLRIEVRLPQGRQLREDQLKTLERELLRVANWQQGVHVAKSEQPILRLTALGQSVPFAITKPDVKRAVAALRRASSHSGQAVPTEDKSAMRAAVDEAFKGATTGGRPKHDFGMRGPQLPKGAQGGAIIARIDSLHGSRLRTGTVRSVGLKSDVRELTKAPPSTPGKLTAQPPQNHMNGMVEHLMKSGFAGVQGEMFVTEHGNNVGAVDFAIPKSRTQQQKVISEVYRRIYALCDKQGTQPHNFQILVVVNTRNERAAKRMNTDVANAYASHQRRVADQYEALDVFENFVQANEVAQNDRPVVVTPKGKAPREVRKNRITILIVPRGEADMDAERTARLSKRYGGATFASAEDMDAMTAMDFYYRQYLSTHHAKIGARAQ